MTDKKDVERDMGSNVFLNLIRGNFGLAGTFWGWGVVGGVLLTVILIDFVSGTGASSLVIPFLLIWFVYLTTVFIGVWRSDKSDSFLSIVSKLFVMLVFAIIAIILLYIIAYSTVSYPNH